MDGGHVYLNLLERFTLAQIDPHVASGDLGKLGSNCMAQIYQVSIVEHLRTRVVKAPSRQFPLVFALFHELPPRLLLLASLVVGRCSKVQFVGSGPFVEVT